MKDQKLLGHSIQYKPNEKYPPLNNWNEMFVQICSHKISFKTLEKILNFRLEGIPWHLNSKLLLSYHIRPNCSWLYTVGSWKFPNMKTPWPLWPTFTVFMVKKFLLYPLGASRFNFCLLSLPATHLWRAWLHLLIYLFVGIQRLLLGPPKAFSSPLPQLLLIGSVLQPPDQLCWTCLSLAVSALY